MADLAHTRADDQTGIEADVDAERLRRKRELALGYRIFGAMRWGQLGDGHISALEGGDQCVELSLIHLDVVVGMLLIVAEAENGIYRVRRGLAKTLILARVACPYYVVVGDNLEQRA